jgi:hypothetical protein
LGVGDFEETSTAIAYRVGRYRVGRSESGRSHEDAAMGRLLQGKYRVGRTDVVGLGRRGHQRGHCRATAVRVQGRSL